jgi:LmbE family N-acetylglucosaminyl deacetylase
VVAPHPDDEALGAAISMHRRVRTNRVHIVHLTDGSPNDMAEARKLGFASRLDYASARRRELQEALHPIGVTAADCTALGFTDQEVFLNFPAVIARLDSLVRELRPECVLSPAYEGGHPDHDGASFAVAMLRKGGHRFAHREFPLYHSDPRGEMITGRFLAGPYSGNEEVLTLSPDERDLKVAVLECFPSQREILSHFGFDFERFRMAPAYDFTQPPHPGPLLYERWGWSIHGEAWREQAIRAQIA